VQIHRDSVSTERRVTGQVFSDVELNPKYSSFLTRAFGTRFEYDARMVALKDAERDIDRRSPEEIAFSLQSQIRGTTLVVGPGQFSPHANHQRVLVLCVDRSGIEPSVIWDRFLHKESIVPLIRALQVYAQMVWLGEFDTMYATPWAYAWTMPPEVFRLYDRKGCVIQLQEEKLVLRREDKHVIIALSDVAQVIGWLSDDWYKREVRIVTHQGEHFVVAEAEEEMAHLDPTYDGINLMCDAAWVRQLGFAMAQGLGVPYTSDNSTLA